MNGQLEDYEASAPNDGLPDLFIALADTLVKHLTAEQMESGNSPQVSSLQVSGLCLAGGVNPYSRRHATNAENYIRSALGLESVQMERPICNPSQMPTKAVPVKGYKPIPVTAGMVYILRNASIPGLLKIGFTSATESVSVRVRQLSQSTSIPTAFEVVASFQSDTAYMHEQKIHRLLAGVKSKKREFFAVNEADAIAACEQVIGGAA